ncbi:hypothetical protein [Paracoccus sp. S3-43]|uniref:hypothetical protein n=1 Tax=Paracoccus sp. S3-43 TaxID=3030011 RepID=UPI0023B1A83A|nr:hypothetical protein [Paracoccus sp. S3-43]WEF24634.1 hypothetical protein PXD02_01285 [Paracoccus sp. S3-43]
MNRRAVLAGFPAAVLSVSGAQAQETQSPVMALFRQWQAVHAFVEGPGTRGWSDERLAPFHAEVQDLVERMVATSALDAADVCAKLTAFTFGGRHFADDNGRLSATILREAMQWVSEPR